jgi:putative tryptophan/tyrosine transport system substrate-binding protein
MAIKPIIILLVGLALASVLPAEAQQPAKVPKLGWLGAGAGPPSGVSELFWREFRKLGYVEGKNIATEYRYADNKLDRSPPWLMSWSV